MSQAFFPERFGSTNERAPERVAEQRTNQRVSATANERTSERQSERGRGNERANNSWLLAPCALCVCGVQVCVRVWLYTIIRFSYNVMHAIVHVITLFENRTNHLSGVCVSVCVSV